jgi:hypothetical protein
MRKILLLSSAFCLSLLSNAQILGRRTLFSNATLFDQNWSVGCPTAGTSFSNQSGFEPTTAIDPCAPTPVCATGTTGSDVWFKFFAQSTTASIVVNPSASFNVAIQAFSGATCPGIVTIGCVDVGGNNASETLLLTGLTVNSVYYFRIFGSSNGVSNRTGTYSLCGSTGLGTTSLPVELSLFNAFVEDRKVSLYWMTQSESNNAFFEIQRSSDENQYTSIGTVPCAGTTTQPTNYRFIDATPLTNIGFYRLKQIDKDGRQRFSPIIKVKMNDQSTKTLDIFPTIVTDNLNIRIGSNISTMVSVRIINSTGQIVASQWRQLVKGDNLLLFNMPPNSKMAYSQYRSS